MSTGIDVEVPFTTSTHCRVHPPRSAPAGGGRPPLLVALHGQGQSGQRHARWMADAVPPHFASAFPDGFHAWEIRRPERPTRLGHGWYLFTGDQAAFAESLQRSEEALWRLVDAVVEAADADPEQIWLAGFSQGAYLAHCVAVRSCAQERRAPVAGWIGQSGRLKHEFLTAELPSVAGRPVLIQHGRQDEALGVEAAERSAALLTEYGADVTLRLYEAPHVITPEMVRDVRSWLDDA